MPAKKKKRKKTDSTSVAVEPTSPSPSAQEIARTLVAQLALLHRAPDPGSPLAAALGQLQSALDRLAAPPGHRSRLTDMSRELQLRVLVQLPATPLGKLDQACAAMRPLVRQAAADRMRLHGPAGGRLGVPSAAAMLAHHERAAQAAWTLDDLRKLWPTTDTGLKFADFSPMQQFASISGIMGFVHRCGKDEAYPLAIFRERKDTLHEVLAALWRMVGAGRASPTCHSVLLATGVLDFMNQLSAPQWWAPQQGGLSLLDAAADEIGPEVLMRSNALKALHVFAEHPQCRAKLVQLGECVDLLGRILASQQEHPELVTRAAITLSLLMLEPACWRRVLSGPTLRALVEILPELSERPELGGLDHRSAGWERILEPACHVLVGPECEHLWPKVFLEIRYLLAKQDSRAGAALVASLDLQEGPFREAAQKAKVMDMLPIWPLEIHEIDLQAFGPWRPGIRILAALRNLVSAGNMGHEDELWRVLALSFVSMSARHSLEYWDCEAKLMLIIMSHLQPRSSQSLGSDYPDLVERIAHTFISLHYYPGLDLYRIADLGTYQLAGSDGKAVFACHSYNEALGILALRACTVLLNQDLHRVSYAAVCRLQTMLRRPVYQQHAVAAFSTFADKQPLSCEFVAGIATKLFSSRIFTSCQLSSVELDQISKLVVKLCGEHCDVVVAAGVVERTLNGIFLLDADGHGRCRELQILEAVCQSREGLNRIISLDSAVRTIAETFDMPTMLCEACDAVYSAEGAADDVGFDEGDVVEMEMAAACLHKISEAALLGPSKLKQVYLQQFQGSRLMRRDGLVNLVQHLHKQGKPSAQTYECPPPTDKLVGLLSMILGNTLALLWPNTSYIEHLNDSETASLALLERIAQDSGRITQRSVAFVLGLVSLSAESWTLTPDTVFALRGIANGQCEEGKAGACAALMACNCAPEAVIEAAQGLRTLVETGGPAGKGQALHVLKQLCDDDEHHDALLAVNMQDALAPLACAKDGPLDDTQLWSSAKAAMDGVCRTGKGKAAMAQAIGQMYLSANN